MDKSKKLSEYGIKTDCSLHMVVSAAIGGGASSSSKASPAGEKIFFFVFDFAPIPANDSLSEPQPSLFLDPTH